MAGGRGGTIDGGNGGSGGVGYAGAAGGDGTQSAVVGGGGGGGSAGGGAGGNGGPGSYGSGGLGGGTAANPGIDGTIGIEEGGSGGGQGGQNGAVGPSLAGGGVGTQGGNGGASNPSTGDGCGGGGGGEGGYGYVVTAVGPNTSYSAIFGGNGGNGGNSITYGGGSGGDGGVGVFFAASGTSLINNSGITGGNGGLAGTGGSNGGKGATGAGGAGIVGSGLNINNINTISGGMSGDGLTQADAIDFTGGTNTLANTGRLNGAIGVTGTLSIISPRVFPSTSIPDVTLSNVIHDYTAGSGSLVFADGGKVTLTAVNTYTGTTVITATSTLALSGVGSIAQSSSVGVDGTFDISAATNDTTITALTGSGNVVLGTHTLSVTGASLGSVFAGVINGQSGLTISGGTEALTGTNTYTGPTTISSGATLQFGVGGAAGQINAAGAVIDNGTLAFNHTDVLTFSNAISGAGSLTHAGTGTLILSGVDSYTGATIVSAGTLFVNTALSGGGAVSVATGAFLGGTGNVAGTVTVDGTISGGQGVGTLATGSLTLHTGATFHEDVATSTVADHVNVTGAVTLAGLLDFSTPTDFAAGVGQNLKLIDNDGTADAVIGRFTSLHVNGATIALAADDTFQIQGHSYLIDYHGGDGNDVAIRDITPASGGGGGTTPTQPTAPTTPIPQVANAPEFGMTVTDTASTAGTVYSLYKELLGRAPDPLGLESFTTAVQKGASLADVANALLASGERTGMPNPATNPTGFVQGLYQSLLARAADASGLQTFTGELAAGVSPGTVAVQLATSAEAQAILKPTFAAGVFVPDASEASVARLYYGLLGRAPDAGGLKALSAFVENGGVGAAGEAARLGQAAASIISSPEFATSHPGGTDTAFVTSLYQGALGRSPDAGGQALYLDQLSHGVSRATVALEIAQSPEAQVHLVGVIEQGFQLAG